MKLLFLLYNLISVWSYCVGPNDIINTVSSKPFMIMSVNCLLASNQTYGCSDIPNILIYDPDSQTDVKHICKCSRTIGFTNEQLAELATSRFNEEGFHNCKLNVLDNLGNKQFKDQCPTIYNETCNT